MKLILSISPSKKTASVGSRFLLQNNIGEVLAPSGVRVEKNLNTLIRDSFDFFSFLFFFVRIPLRCNRIALGLVNVVKKKRKKEVIICFKKMSLFSCLLCIINSI